ncbi:MAG TPA: hypothetical protein QF469_08785 [Sphingomonas sanguinis]|uniref:hypothetical protein n=1 Tax=Sphingomonas sanguinis TaxID=33051 RepID=UPI002AC19FEB|nr:hypothetical protein [Sphingomonas sanguinis]
MSETALTLLTIAWPPVAAWLVLKLVPGSLTKFVEKEIDRRSDAKLEAIKAELQGAYSTLKTSVDIVSASSSGMRPHIIAAVSALWSHMIEMRDTFGGVMGFDSTITADEAQDMFSGRATNVRPLEFVRAFDGEVHNNVLMTKFNAASLDEHRLFCGDRLWLLFYIYRAVTLRNAFLISMSFEERRYRDWRKDSGVSQLLGSVLSEGDIAKFHEMTLGGLAAALSRLEGEFLHEAARVMSGSKALAESLSDMQALMLLHNAQIIKGK